MPIAMQDASHTILNVCWDKALRLDAAMLWIIMYCSEVMPISELDMISSKMPSKIKKYLCGLVVSRIEKKKIVNITKCGFMAMFIMLNGK